MLIDLYFTGTWFEFLPGDVQSALNFLVVALSYRILSQIIKLYSEILCLLKFLHASQSLIIPLRWRQHLQPKLQYLYIVSAS
jgi:hypothetical protein